MKCSGRAYKILKALIYQDRVKYVHQGLVDEESLEEKCYNHLTFPQHQDGGIDPCSRSMEDVEHGNLWKIGPEEQIDVDEARQEGDREETSSKKGPQKTPSGKVPDALYQDIGQYLFSRSHVTVECL